MLTIDHMDGGYNPISSVKKHLPDSEVGEKCPEEERKQKGKDSRKETVQNIKQVRLQCAIIQTTS